MKGRHGTTMWKLFLRLKLKWTSPLGCLACESGELAEIIIGYHWWIFWIFESRQGDAWFLDVTQCYTGYFHGSCFFAHWNQGKNFWLMVATSSRMAKMRRFRTLQELPVGPGSENGVLSVMTIHWYIRWNDFCCSWCPDPCFRWHLALLHSYNPVLLKLFVGLRNLVYKFKNSGPDFSCVNHVLVCLEFVFTSFHVQSRLFGSVRDGGHLASCKALLLGSPGKYRKDAGAGRSCWVFACVKLQLNPQELLRYLDIISSIFQISYDACVNDISWCTSRYFKIVSH